MSDYRNPMTKKCQPYEKRWRDYCIDKNLEERWLEELNDLKSFNLISICEGHHAPNKNTLSKYSHINLRLKESLLPGFLKDWETLRPEILNEIHNLFQKGDTYFNLELRFKLRAGRGRLVYQEELTLKMRRFKLRTSDEMNPEIYQWFDQSVESVKTLDQIVRDWHHTKMS